MKRPLGDELHSTSAKLKILPVFLAVSGIGGLFVREAGQKKCGIVKHLADLVWQVNIA